MKKILLALVLLMAGTAYVVLAISIAPDPVRLGDSDPSLCCSERTILAYGTRAAYKALNKGDIEEAKRILEKTAEGADVPLY